MDCREFVEEYQTLARAIRHNGPSLSLEDFIKIQEIRVLKQIAKSLEKLSERMPHKDAVGYGSIDGLFN